MGYKLHYFLRDTALFILAVLAGSTFPDLDHVFPPFYHSWGHVVYFPIILLGGFLLGVALAYLCRLCWIRVLIKLFRMRN